MNDKKFTNENENKKFDYNVNDISTIDIKQHTTIVICSKRNTGKSVLARNIIYKLITSYDYNYIVVFSDTGRFNGDYSFMEQEYIYPWDDKADDRLIKIMNYQEKNIKKGVNALIILDDVNLQKKSTALGKLFTQGRHFKITLLLSAQYPKGLTSPIIRNNIDYLFVSELNSETLMNLVRECFIISGISDKEIFNYIIDNNHNHQFIMYNNTEHDKKQRLKIVKGKMLELKLIDNKAKKKK